MSQEEEWATIEPTSEGTINIACHADRRMFLPEFDSMPQKMQDYFEAGASIPCHGHGGVGVWCSECNFSKIEDADD